MTTTDTSPADILDFRLLDEAGHPALNIEEEGRSNVLRLEIENVSANTLAFPLTSQRRATKEEHHFSLSFRPGALSEETLARLTKYDPPMGVLGADAKGWDLRVERNRRPIDPVTLYFLYTASGDTPRMEPHGGGDASMLQLQLHNIAASPGDGVRPSAAQLGIDKMYVGNRLDNFFRLQRRTELYITHAGGRPCDRLPLRLDLLDDVTIECGPPSNSHSVHLVLSNIAADTPIEGDYITLVMDVGTDERFWALTAKGEQSYADYASLIATPVGSRNRLQGEMESEGDQGFPNALKWKIDLPNGRLLPGHGIDLSMSIMTNRAMPLAIHIDSDLAHFGANRQTFLFPRNRLTMRQFDRDISKLKTRTSATEGATQRAERTLTTHSTELGSLRDEVASLKQDFNSQITRITQATNDLIGIYVKDMRFACDLKISSLRTKNTKPDAVKMHFSIVRGGDGEWRIGPTFSGSATLEQSPQPKEGAFLEFPGAKNSKGGYALWFYTRNGLLFEFYPHLGRLYYHGEVHGISVADLPEHTPRLGHIGGMADMTKVYNEAKSKLLKNTRWTTKQSLIDFGSLVGPL